MPGTAKPRNKSSNTKTTFSRSERTPGKEKPTPRTRRTPTRSKGKKTSNSNKYSKPSKYGAPFLVLQSQRSLEFLVWLVSLCNNQRKLKMKLSSEVYSKDRRILINLLRTSTTRQEYNAIF